MFGTNLNHWDLLVVVFYFAFQFSLGLIIPNPIGGRMCFLFCGLMIVAIGGLLYRASHAHKKRKDAKKAQV